jgi:hypothetical protein
MTLWDIGTMRGRSPETAFKMARNVWSSSDSEDGDAHPAGGPGDDRPLALDGPPHPHFTRNRKTSSSGGPEDQASRDINSRPRRGRAKAAKATQLDPADHLDHITTMGEEESGDASSRPQWGQAATATATQLSDHEEQYGGLHQETQPPLDGRF